MSAVKKPQKTLKIGLFAQNKPGVAKPIRPAHPGTGIGRVIAAMTGRRSAPSLPENAAPTGLCSSPIGWERARVRVDKGESLKHHQNHDKNRTARCGRILRLGHKTRHDLYPKIISILCFRGSYLCRGAGLLSILFFYIRVDWEVYLGSVLLAF